MRSSVPMNIKQIGSMGDGLRIYMEDYVLIFMQQFSEAAGFEERLAFLVGQDVVIDGQPVLFVEGAIHGKHVEKHEGHLRFTEQSMDYVDEILKQYYPNSEIVGWMQSQPSYGSHLNQHYGAYHLRQFKKPHQVMFVIDPLDKTNAFYMANESSSNPTDKMVEIPGYFIFYEKNVAMHDYMINYKPDPADHHLKLLNNDENNGNNGTNANQNQQPNNDAAAASTHRKEQRRATNLLAGLSAVLFVVAFIMGIGLIRNQDRIDQLEQTLAEITANQTALQQQIAAATPPEIIYALNSAEIAAIFTEFDVILWQHLATHHQAFNADGYAITNPHEVDFTNMTLEEFADVIANHQADVYVDFINDWLQSVVGITGYQLADRPHRWLGGE